MPRRAQVFGLSAPPDKPKKAFLCALRVSNESRLEGRVGGDNGLACQLCLCGENFILDKTEHLWQLLFEITAVGSEIMTVSYHI